MPFRPSPMCRWILVTLAAAVSLSLPARAQTSGVDEAPGPADPPVPTTQPLALYLTTYDNVSPPIYRVLLDPDTGDLSKPQKVLAPRDKAGRGARAFVFHPTIPILYVTTGSGGKTPPTRYSAVTCFAIDPIDGSLKFVNTVSSDEPQASAVAINDSGSMLYVGNRYWPDPKTSASLSSVTLEPSGRLGQISSTVEGYDREVNPLPLDRYPGFRYLPFPSPDGDIVLALEELGADAIFLHGTTAGGGLQRNPVEADPAMVDRLKIKTSQRTHIRPRSERASGPPQFRVEEGTNPAFLAFHPELPVIYVRGSTKMQLAVYQLDTAATHLRPLGTHVVEDPRRKLDDRNKPYVRVRADPMGMGVSVFEDGLRGEVHIDRDGRFLYVSSRDSGLRIFQINPDTGRLMPAETVPEGVPYPITFDIDPTGRWLVAVDHATGSLVSFQIDPDTGGLTRAGELENNAMIMLARFMPIYGGKSE